MFAIQRYTLYLKIIYRIYLYTKYKDYKVELRQFQGQQKQWGGSYAKTMVHLA